MSNIIFFLGVWVLFVIQGLFISGIDLITSNHIDDRFDRLEKMLKELMENKDKP